MVNNFRTYHGWIDDALESEMARGATRGAFLVDLHGHGHPHNFIELGYGLKAELIDR